MWHQGLNKLHRLIPEMQDLSKMLAQIVHIFFDLRVNSVPELSLHLRRFLLLHHGVAAASSPGDLCQPQRVIVAQPVKDRREKLIIPSFARPGRETLLAQRLRRVVIDQRLPNVLLFLKLLSFL